MINNLDSNSSDSSISIISDSSISSVSSNNPENVNIKLIEETYPNVENVDMKKLKISDVGKYSTSKTSGASQLVKYINRYCKLFNVEKCSDLIITDGTGNNGSDTIYLALNFKHVNSIEKDPNEFEILKNNVETYKLQNINLYNESSLDMIAKLKQDIVYIDAPWGGISYKDYRYVRLYMDKQEISQIYKNNKEYAKLFIFKVPKNYDFNNFIITTRNNFFEIHAVMSSDNTKIKYYFIFITHLEN